ncbi:MAG: Glucose-6-phosphate 1-dehydrogenase [Candidatus Carbobacillus altaicus]|uniref:Glucose-6-phosphate 1-dehydrogenase n=1 Tax=Candidatus Carbonibacillus altaicus TaxID=2163959 RepID=A0A2R6Y4M6_9BACL|nr:MAG: Glucose-6-phosphate 1-dehydrogenase [Candidatus Carbobacillus altaicus]
MESLNTSAQINAPQAAILLFGATGDLARRKLYPALYQLYRQKKLHPSFFVFGMARRPMDDETYRALVAESLENPDEQFLRHCYYQSLDVERLEDYERLQRRLLDLEASAGTAGNRLFYLSIAPDHFEPLAHHLKESGLVETAGFRRLVIEKPFGYDLPSAEKLNRALCQVFQESEIFRIDHYLGKTMVQNIEVIRFANSIFEPIWNNRYIAGIQVTASESIGVEERAGYYDRFGALRDMVQNHLLQMVAMVAMEPPSRLETEAIRDEKVKVLNALRVLSGAEIDHALVRGQYVRGIVDGEIRRAYREEDGVDPRSTTETYVAAKIYVDNFRFAHVPFFVRTGKRLRQKITEIVVQFKDVPWNLYVKKSGRLEPNRLIIRIQPDEGIHLWLNTKQGGDRLRIAPVDMEVSRFTGIGFNSPEAYELLLYDALIGDSTNFTRWDEVAASWAWIDPIAKRFKEKGEDGLKFYPAGSMGPELADLLLSKEGLHWWEGTQA